MKKVLLLTLALMSIPAISPAITLDLTQSFTFQEDGTAASKTVDSTIFLKEANGVYGTGGTLASQFFATGTATSWYDAVALDFDLSSLGGDPISSATLMLMARKGTYNNASDTGRYWEHYLVLSGLFNIAYEDSNPDSAPYAPDNGYPIAPSTDFNPGGSLADLAPISNSIDGWYRIALNPALLGTDGNLTLRLWNVSLDAVKLNVTTRNPDAVPETGTLLLLGTGLIALAALRLKKRS